MVFMDGFENFCEADVVDCDNVTHSEDVFFGEDACSGNGWMFDCSEDVGDETGSGVVGSS